MRLLREHNDDGRPTERFPADSRRAGLLRAVPPVSWDAGAWAVALYLAALLRGQTPDEISTSGLFWAWLGAVMAQVLVGRFVAHSYGGRNWTGTVADALSLSATAFLAGQAAFVVNLTLAPDLPRSVPLIACPLAVLLHVGGRVAVRLSRERRSRPHGDATRRVIVVGAGADGQQLVRTMLSDPEGYLPAAIVDDNPRVRCLRVCGVPVLGGCADIERVVASTGADLLVIADRSADASSVRRIAGFAAAADVAVKVLPPLPELLRPWMGVANLRDLNINDFLGRRPVRIDVSEECAGYLAHRRVLVTGAGGSIGSELCRQVHRFGPSELLMLDRDESALHDVQLSIYGHALLDSPDVILADVRDAAAITEIVLSRRPDVIFHAAALKHLPMLEQYPDEAWKTNVIGTRNVLAAARLAGVDRFVNISTDKAANPVSVLGLSKRIGERVTAHAARDIVGTYLSVRFGNVLGSRGSVLTTFAEQLANGLPITVTHPDVTRYFMTIPEAVQLVVYAAAIGSAGEVLVLDMGNPVRIADVANQMMMLAGKDVDIVYTGLRDGEKLHEDLFGADEIDRRPIHSMISHVDVPEINPKLLVTRRASSGTAAALWDFGGAVRSQATSAVAMTTGAITGHSASQGQP